MDEASREPPTCVAFCGHPRSGKSTVQGIVERLYGVVPRDDAQVIREAAMVLYGLTRAQVTTQAGKASTVEVMGRPRTVRSLLGGVGNFLIAEHGTLFKPTAALRMARRWALESNRAGAIFSFGSVRLDEARAYRDAGGLVVEVVRPGCVAARPEDDYDRSLVDLTLHNDGTLESLEAQVVAALGPRLSGRGRESDDKVR